MELKNTFSSSSFAAEEDLAIFAGIDEEFSSDGEIAFGVYCPISGQRAVWLPASASDPEVVEHVKTMQIGQLFRITSEESVGGMGTRVQAMETVETDGNTVIYNIIKEPGIIEFHGLKHNA